MPCSRVAKNNSHILIRHEKMAGYHEKKKAYFEECRSVRTLLEANGDNIAIVR